MQESSSLQRQLFTLFTAGMLLVSFAVGMLSAWNASSDAYDILRNQGLQSATSLANSATLAVLYESPLNVEEAVNAVLENPSVTYVGIFTRHGKAILEKGIRQIELQPDPEKNYTLKEDTQAWHFAVPVFFNTQDRLIGNDLLLLPDENEREWIGSVYLTINKKWLKSLRQEMIVLNLVMSVLVASVMLFMLYRRTRRIILPLKQLTAAMAGVSTSSVRQHISLSGNREVEEIAQAFNAMIDALSERDEKLRLSHANLEELVEERTRELEASNKELQAFSYSVSHDLRAPLRSIDGFSQALYEDYEDQLDEVAKDYLQRVRRNTQRMGNLIDDMLKLSRVTRAEINLQKTDLNKMAEEIVSQLREQNPDRQVQFFNNPVPPAMADASLLHAVMVNLIDNAWKYSSKKSKAVIEFGAEHYPNKLVYYIRDNGAGFNMEYADKLFTAFQRLHNNDEFEGTGVGLATVARIIKRHKGEVWTQSSEGAGATFYFTLPKVNLDG